MAFTHEENEALLHQVYLKYDYSRQGVQVYFDANNDAFCIRVGTNTSYINDIRDPAILAEFVRVFITAYNVGKRHGVADKQHELRVCLGLEQDEDNMVYIPRTY